MLNDPEAADLLGAWLKDRPVWAPSEGVFEEFLERDVLWAFRHAGESTVHGMEELGLGSGSLSVDEIEATHVPVSRGRIGRVFDLLLPHDPTTAHRELLLTAGRSRDERRGVLLPEQRRHQGPRALNRFAGRRAARAARPCFRRIPSWTSSRPSRS